MSNKIDMDDSQNQQNFVYQLLPQARPLQNKQAVQLKSLYQFIADSACVKNIEVEPIQQMETIQLERNNTTQQFGSSLAQMFKQPIYQSYQQLYIGQDNKKFATCSVKLDSTQPLKPMENKGVDDSCLIFQSRFQSGNLAIVSKSKQNPNYYYLALQRDTNSQATCQWYYFYVENRNNIGEHTFNIVNLVKNYSAYQNGMKPCIMSTQAGQLWKRDGYNINYTKNSFMYKGQRSYYSLQFNYNFRNKNDRVYFAYSYPYTFSKLQNLLLQIQTNYPQIVQVKTLALTLKNNPVNMISITNPHSEQGEKKIKKDLIMICARVHPGETNSSFACEGLIKFLLQNSQQSYNLRKYYIIKIIPFLNPDGVIHGNYRTSLSGHDLNRKWKRPDKQIHPQIWYLKKYLRQTGYKKVLFIDLHGHSKKRSSFMYGCLNKQNPYLCKQLPFILSKRGHHFCYFNCNFSTPISRQGTSRMNVWKQFGVDYSYTMQISFCGPIKNYIQMGIQLGKIISLYFCGKKRQSNQNSVVGNILKQFYQQQQLLEQGTQQTSGSQSGQQQLVDQNDKKQQKAFTQNKQTSKQLNGVLTKYLTQTKIKWNRGQTLRNRALKNQQKAASSIRIRKQLQPSRVSIRKIDLSEQINNPYLSFGFMKGNMRLTSKQIKNFDKIQYGKGSYGPYSSSKGKPIHRKSQQHSLMLPKVLREEQLKYRRYRKNESKIQISLGYEELKTKQSGYSRASIHSNRQISLAQKILQSTQRHIGAESSRYWVRNS